MYDEGAWHPSDLFIMLWFVSAIVGLVPIGRLAAGTPRKRVHYLAATVPIVTLFIFMVYFDYGRSGAYTGDGTLGTGVHIDIIGSLEHTLKYTITFVPSVLLIGLSMWGRLRATVPLAFWIIFSVITMLQLLFYFGAVTSLVEPGY
jgi:hypothetical protein